MKYLMTALLTASAFLSVQAFADDSMSRATPTKHQLMKECVEKQKTADVNMSKDQMNRLCKDEVKRKLAGDTPPPPVDVPRTP
jgi:hypothetical protein